MQAEAFYDRLIEDYAFRNDWREACLGRTEECYPQPINSDTIVRTVWDGLPREVTDAAERARECASKVTPADLVAGAGQGMYSAGVRTTVIDVVRGVTRGIPALAAQVAKGAVVGAGLGAVKAARRVCGE